MRRKEWVIIVAQIVSGKSKFPHKKVGRFTRYKPEHYSEGNKPHKIVYARKFLGTDKVALQKAEQVDKEMFNTYIFSMGNVKHACVSEFTVVLHNITEDKSKQISSTIRDSDSESEAYLYQGESCSNAKLSSWGIVKGLR